MRAWSLVEALDEAETADEAWSLGLAALKGFGIDKAIWMDGSGSRPPALRSNCPQDWLEAYGREVSSGGDPFVTYCLASARPVRTGVGYLDRYGYLSASEKGFIAQASEATATRTGTSVTTARGRAGWNLMSDMNETGFEAMFAEQGADLMLCAQVIHASIAADTHARILLSARERDCLTLVATGCRMAEVAGRLDISEATVELHLRNARKRLGARTRDEAVARALISGAIWI